MKKSLQYLGAIALALALASNVQAVPLETLLLPGSSIMAGDKLFDQWQVIFEDASDPGFNFTYANIDVAPLNDGGLEPGPGLAFSILNGEFDVTGDGIFAYKDFTFGFRVSVLPGSPLLIKDNSLGFVSFGAGLQYLSDSSNDLGVFILETIGTAPGLSNLGTKNVEFSILDDVLTSQVTDSASFAPQREIWVTKNILVWAVDDTDSAFLNGFEQRFSQTSEIPEPATFVLFGLGLAGLGLVRLRRRKV